MVQLLGDQRDMATKCNTWGKTAARALVEQLIKLEYVYRLNESIIYQYKIS